MNKKEIKNSVLDKYKKAVRDYYREFYGGKDPRALNFAEGKMIAYEDVLKMFGMEQKELLEVSIKEREKVLADMEG